MGASVVNALSEWTKAKVYRDGKIYEVLFSRGSIVKEMRITGECAKEKAGTEVTFCQIKKSLRKQCMSMISSELVSEKPHF